MILVLIAIDRTIMLSIGSVDSQVLHVWQLVVSIDSAGREIGIIPYDQGLNS